MLPEEDPRRDETCNALLTIIISATTNGFLYTFSMVIAQTFHTLI